MIDAETMKQKNIFQKLFSLCFCSQLSMGIDELSYRYLARGLGSSSGELGHNVMDHHFRVGASGEVEGYEDKYYLVTGRPVFIFHASEILG